MNIHIDMVPLPQCRIMHSRHCEFAFPMKGYPKLQRDECLRRDILHVNIAGAPLSFEYLLNALLLALPYFLTTGDCKAVTFTSSTPGEAGGHRDQNVPAIY